MSIRNDAVRELDQQPKFWKVFSGIVAILGIPLLASQWLATDVNPTIVTGAWVVIFAVAATVGWLRSRTPIERSQGDHREGK